MSSVSTALNKFICPFVAAMGATGSANYAYVQQEKVTIAGIDYNFAATLSAADTKKLLEAFTVSGNGPANGFNVTLSGSGDLQAVLAAYIASALETSSPAAGAVAGRTLNAQLVADLANGLKAAINGAGAYASAPNDGTGPAFGAAPPNSIDGLINTVENLDVTNVSVTVDALGGALAMATGLTDARCDLIYEQIPATGLNLYMDASENQVTSALPLAGGDVLVFVWDVDLQDVVPVKSQLQVPAGQTPGTAPVSVADIAGNYTSGLHYNEPAKRCAFALTMAGGSGKITGLRA